MSDPHYPTIDLQFLEQCAEACGKIQGTVKIGDTVAFVLEGDKALHKRFIVVRQLEANQITFENATGLAIRLNFMGKLLAWLETNKGWKDGAYTEG